MAEMQLENVEKLGDVPRPDKGGTLGRKTVIRVNHFLAKISLPEIYHYRVSQIVQFIGLKESEGVKNTPVLKHFQE